MHRSSLRLGIAPVVIGTLAGGWLAAPGTAEAGSYNLDTINAPGAAYTLIYGINDNRLISGLGLSSSFLSTGFLDDKGKFSLVQAPLPGGGTAVDTEFYQVNNAGKVAVSYYGADGVYHAATFDGATNTWTYLPDVAGAAENLAGGINNNGLVFGDTFTDGSFGGGVGWTRDGSKYTFFTAPWADPSLTPGGTATYSGNDAGEVVGYGIDSSGTYHGFLMTGPGAFTELDDPGAAAFGGTVAEGLNNLGVVTGYYHSDASGDVSGFLWQGDTFSSFNIPGAVSTNVTSINDLGDLAGYYVDASGSIHGFVAFVTPEPGTLGLLGVGLAAMGLGGWRRRSRASA